MASLPRPVRHCVVLDADELVALTQVLSVADPLQPAAGAARHEDDRGAGAGHLVEARRMAVDVPVIEADEVRMACLLSSREQAR